MSAQQVTLGDQARAAAARHLIPEPHVRLARAHGSSTYDTPEFLVVIATLPDGRRVEMRCAHDDPQHVLKLRLT